MGFLPMYPTQMRLQWKGEGFSEGQWPSGYKPRAKQRVKHTTSSPPLQTMLSPSHGPNFFSSCTEICSSEASQQLTGIAGGAWSCNGKMNYCLMSEATKQEHKHNRTRSNCFIGTGDASSLASTRDRGHRSLHFSLVFLISKFIYYPAPTEIHTGLSMPKS